MKKYTITNRRGNGVSLRLAAGGTLSLAAGESLVRFLPDAQVETLSNSAGIAVELVAEIAKPPKPPVASTPAPITKAKADKPAEKEASK